MRSQVADLLADLGTALAAVRVEWLLFGAQAAILYGVARLTADVDVTARVPATLSNRALVDALTEVVRLLESALGQSDLIPLFEGAVARAAERGAR
ncbi:MAG: hypothetical protein ABL982_12870 [Vicinamibacterales bacterium]